MSATVTTGAVPNLSLSQLSDWLWGQEIAHGPVIAIGNNGHSTAATFRLSLTEPAIRAEIRPAVGGAAIIPPGATLCCEGPVFIADQLVEVVVFRS